MEKDYIAKLVIKDIPSLTINDKSRLVEWLREYAKEIEKCNPSDYAKWFTSTLLKPL